ncbi:hypothetical protein WAI453_012343 [Rhynchosporium graminicola]
MANAGTKQGTKVLGGQQPVVHTRLFQRPFEDSKIQRFKEFAEGSQSSSEKGMESCMLKLGMVCQHCWPAIAHSNSAPSSLQEFERYLFLPAQGPRSPSCLHHNTGKPIAITAIAVSEIHNQP